MKPKSLLKPLERLKLSLQITYEDTGAIRKSDFYASLFQTKFEEFHSMTAYIDHITSIKERKYREIIRKWKCRPYYFRRFIRKIRLFNRPITNGFVKNLLLQENAKNLSSTSKSSDNAFYGKSTAKFLQNQKNKYTRKPRCFNYNQLGHFSSSCTKTWKGNLKH